MELGNLKSLKIVAVLMCVVLISHDRLRGLIELVLYLIGEGDYLKAWVYFADLAKVDSSNPLAYPGGKWGLATTPPDAVNERDHDDTSNPPESLSGPSSYTICTSPCSPSASASAPSGSARPSGPAA